MATNPQIGPIYQYNHNNGDLSITGGYVYRGSSNNPDLQGKYIYGDYVSGRVWSLDYNSGNNSATSKLLFRTNGEYVSSFGLDESGELYFSGYGNSAKIFKIIGGDENTDPSNTVVDGIGSWQDIENGTNGNIEAVITSGDDLFVAGSFSTAGSIAANNIAVYTKNEGWKTLSSGANGSVNALAIASNGNLYAGGEFTNIGGVEAKNIAVWNGSNWSPLGTGTNGSVAKIIIDQNDNVYAGGAFENAGGIIVHNIAKWKNGWSPLSDSGTLISGTNNEIRSVALHNGQLIVGGNFDSAGGKTANRIATWNGSSWNTLGEGTSGFVQAILVQSGYIYAGGNFTLAGGKTVNRISRWNITSKSWEGLGNGTSGNVNALATDGTYIYLGGNFETVSDVTESNYVMNNMARWSESSGFEALGTSKNVGTDNQVNSIYFSANGNDLYVGGNFNAAGNSTSSKLAVWSQNFNCSDADISMEYSLNGINWISGDSRITVDEGTSVQIRKRGLGSTYTITLPNGTVHSGSYDLGIINPDQAGVYRITGNDGCSRAFEIFVISDGDTCPTGSIVPQYQVNGTWFKGYNNLSVQPGAEVVLSMYPEDIGLEITLPSGEVVGDEHSLGAVTTANNGTYILTSEEGCTTEINLTVNEGTSSCDEILIPEYRINGKWSNGEDVITINQGSEVIFSMLPNGVAMALTLPDGTIVEDNYKISNFALSKAGTYLLTSSQGCSKALEVNVVDECEEDSVIPEYRIDGIWSNGENTLIVDEGSDVVLSMLPENVGLTIVRPDGTLVSDNYAMRSIKLEQAGIYTFFSEEGCSATLDITVNGSVNCTAESIIPEYRIDGIWKSGQNYLKVDAGTDLLLSMLPNDIGLTITTPDGRQVADNYSLRNVTDADSGVYVLRSSEGCKTTLTLDVSKPGTGKSSPLDEFQGDFKNYHSVKNEFAVYPNPTMDQATMDIQTLQGRPLSVILSNMQQQTLISEILTEDHSSSLTFDMSNFPPGMYIIKLTLDNGEVITRKIIKKR
ncbi:T9SS type A sorting domain-containing protein [Maribacter halichondriae]|uniref:T9SS type A sorting domain-containing protein n=1 Tax=Maribacter halichondriae TaxID=2980554 RepID=UPI002359EED8|nr:T9SS type A sorting domain-containing protein [Maribacter sp. Hal144]